MDIIMQEQNSLLCCRACLMSDCRLYGIHEYKLANVFSKLSGISVSKDHLPQHLCAYCLVLLLKCASFRDMCRKSHNCLLEELINGKLYSDGVRNISCHQRSLNLIITEVETVECIPTDEDLNNGPNEDNASIDDDDDADTGNGLENDINDNVDEAVSKTEVVIKKGRYQTVFDDIKHKEKDVLRDGQNKETGKKGKAPAKGIVVPKIKHGYNKAVDAMKIGDDNFEDSLVFKDNHKEKKGARRRAAAKENLLEMGQEYDKAMDTIEISDNEDSLVSNRGKVNKNETKSTNKVSDFIVLTVNQDYHKVTNVAKTSNNNSNLLNPKSGKVNEKGGQKNAVSEKSVSKIGIKDDVADVMEISDDEDKDSVVPKDSKDKERKTVAVVPKIFLKKIVPVANVNIITSIPPIANNDKMKMMTIEMKNNKLELMVDDESDGEEGLVYYEETLDDERLELIKKFNPKRVESRQQRTVYLDAEFESTYNVRIVFLNRQEQLEEIVSRKKSRKYLESPFKCEDCGKGFKVEVSYVNHLLRHNHEWGDNACDICGIRFKNHHRLKTHEDQHRVKFICKECNCVTRTRVKARIHHSTHDGTTRVCPHCGKSIKQMLPHLRWSHPEQCVACEVCGELCVSAFGLAQHKTRAHSEKPPQVECTTCSAVFNSVEALNRHTDTAGEHRGLRPCEQCGENCASETELQEHVGVMHPDESRYCEECNTTFSNAAAFDVHSRKHKTLAWRCVCEQCGYIARNSAVLECHMASHLGLKPYGCPQCPKTFAAKLNFKRHMRAHTGEKPYQCPECPLRFTLGHNRNRHYKVAHLGVRERFPCPLCPSERTTKSDLRVHMRAAHTNEGEPTRDRKKRDKSGTGKKRDWDSDTD